MILACLFLATVLIAILATFLGSYTLTSQSFLSGNWYFSWRDNAMRLIGIGIALSLLSAIFAEIAPTSAETALLTAASCLHSQFVVFICLPERQEDDVIGILSRFVIASMIMAGSPFLFLGCLILAAYIIKRNRSGLRIERDWAALVFLAIIALVIDVGLPYFLPADLSESIVWPAFSAVVLLLVSSIGSIACK